jgi:hypothetical protein
VNLHYLKHRHAEGDAFSVHPMQGAPIPIGHTSGISLKCRVEHPA